MVNCLLVNVVKTLIVLKLSVTKILLQSVKTTNVHVFIIRWFNDDLNLWRIRVRSSTTVIGRGLKSN
ncbi:hypothetical protein P8452_07285 [Trifolium repens]|nr:hypothetical protein P8452_07285 [Trifolium repens]